MKAIRLASLIALFLLLSASCTNEALLPDGGNEPGGDVADTEGVSGYMSFILKQPEGGNTRDEESDRWWEYQDSEGSEATVDSVRFYFFNSDREIVASRNGNSIYYPCTNVTEVTVNPNAPDVEKIYRADLTLELSGTPSWVVAVVNPFGKKIDHKLDSIKGEREATNKRLTIEDFHEVVCEFKQASNKDSFVMSNSAYVTYSYDSEGKRIAEALCAIPIGSGNLYTTEEEAQSNPVTIYVERVVARINLGFDSKLKKQGDFFETGVTYKPTTENNSASDTTIYVKFLGWAVTSTPKVSRMLKTVDKDWDEETFFTTSYSWTAPRYHRSFWAINPQPAALKDNNGNLLYDWFNYNDITGEREDMSPEDKARYKERKGTYEVKEKNYAYMQENANPYSATAGYLANPDYHSKVICAGQLVDKDGKPVTITEYDSKYYTIAGLKNLVAASLNMWYPLAGDKYTKIEVTDIDFITATEHDPIKGPDDAEESYYVYVTLTEDAKKKTWYSDLKGDSDQPQDSQKITNIQKYLDERLFPVKIWNNGYTYYFFDVTHQDVNIDAPGHFGVVRNHVYDATVKSISSLGVPVYDPEEKIYPEWPPSKGNQLEVDIRVLQWRLVNKHFQMSW